MLTTILWPSNEDACRVSMTILGILLSAAINRCLVPLQIETKCLNSKSLLVSLLQPPLPSFLGELHYTSVTDGEDR